MAKRSSGTTPYSKVMSPKVFPVVPLRTALDTAADDTPVYEEVELNLQFENNEVFDIMKVETWLSMTTVPANPANGGLDGHVGLLDNPSSIANLDTDVTFETIPELFYYAKMSWTFFEDAAPASHQHFKHDVYHVNVYTEPFTVARNVRWTLTVNPSADFFGYAMSLRGIIWGRRRKASDAEFKDIIYRERF